MGEQFGRITRWTAGGGALATALLAGSMFWGVTVAYAAQAPVGLGTATSFAVLAGSGITNTGSTTITGDVGTFPTTSETGFGSVTLNGANHGGDAVTQGAKSDLVTAYDDAAGRTPRTNVPVELGGSTLLAGVYTSPTFGLTGTLSLDAQGDPSAEFIFQAGSTLITASNSQVLLLNGADPCHIVWQVGSSATFGTGTKFVGDVLALQSITANNGATFQGRLLARNGAVTLDTNTLTNGNCVTASGGTTAPAGTATTPASAATAPAETAAAPTGAAPSSSGAATATAAGPTAAAKASPPTRAAAPPAKPSAAAPGPARPAGSPPFATTGFHVAALTYAALALLALGAALVTIARAPDRIGWGKPLAHSVRRPQG